MGNLTGRIEPDKSTINFPTNRAKTRPQSDLEYVPRPYKDIAGGYETQFLKLMIDQMKKTVPENEQESTASEFYDDLLSGERAKIMAKQNEGMGLQELILDQIYPKRLRNEITYKNFAENKKMHNGKKPIGISDERNSVAIEKGNGDE